jgi:hypothetical protein
MKNIDGPGVGRGLKMAGSIKYVCQRCKENVGFTEDEYWKHQEAVHNNPRTRIFTIKERRNKLQVDHLKL